MISGQFKFEEGVVMCELERMRLLKEANRVLDRIESTIHFIVDSIKAKQGGQKAA
jgi:hypothetical protein